MPDLRTLTDADLSPDDLVSIRRLCDAAFGSGYTDDDWANTCDGHRVVAIGDGAVVAHAAVIERSLLVGDRTFRTGYVEGVATEPALQGTGLGTSVMHALAATITTKFEFGALATGSHHFYERVGWHRWTGQTLVAGPNGRIRRPDEDVGLMALRFGPSRDVDLSESLTCWARRGDDW